MHATIGAVLVLVGASLLNQVGAQPEIMHFKLLGPDWSKIPPGYSGVTPGKVVTELYIPMEYVVRENFFRLKGPLTNTESSVPIAFYYPSMRGSDGKAATDDYVGVAISAGREEAMRNGVKELVSSAGRTRDPGLDVDGLCGYVDHEHPGYKGDEFYVACDEAMRDFGIICFPPFNDHCVCIESVFVGAGLTVDLTYRFPIIPQHQAILSAIRKLIISFNRPTSQP